MKRKVKFEQTTLLMVGINQAAIGKSMVNHCTVGGGGGERGCIYIGASAHSTSYTATLHTWEQDLAFLVSCVYFQTQMYCVYNTF